MNIPDYVYSEIVELNGVESKSKQLVLEEAKTKHKDRTLDKQNPLDHQFKHYCVNIMHQHEQQQGHQHHQLQQRQKEQHSQQQQQHQQQHKQYHNQKQHHRMQQPQQQQQLHQQLPFDETHLDAVRGLILPRGFHPAHQQVELVRTIRLRSTRTNRSAYCLCQGFDSKLKNLD